MREMADQRNYPQTAGASLGGMARREDVTLRENIDQQIEQAEARVKELQETKARLMTSGILDTRIDDLSRAMRF